jgi:predicted nucleotidyltransferase
MKELPENVQTALRYLQDQIQQNGAIVLFGSRAAGSSKKNADFDIGLLMQKHLAWKTFAVWKTTAEELAWPYRLELVDLGRAPKEFLQAIKSQMRILHGAWYDSKTLARES